MTTTRRTFLGHCLAAGGTTMMWLSGCRGCRKGLRSDDGHSAQQKAEPLLASTEPGYLKLERDGVLAEREETLYEILRSCQLCPRRCGVDRLAGETGRCSTGGQIRVASFGPHFGEEPPLVGKGGSGTIFFSNCNLLCIFCQNYPINHLGQGQPTSPAELADMMLSLQRQGCHNINLVTPTHVVPQIVRALRIAIAGGLHLPLVYNTGGYDSLRALQLLDGIVDIYLPDFKYQDGQIAARLSAGATDYPEVAATGIREMHRQTGVMQEVEGLAQRGLMLRHLVLPNQQAGTDRFVRFVAEELHPDTYVNIMGQYRPMHRASEFEEVSRRTNSAEMRQAMSWARAAGLRRIRS